MNAATQLLSAFQIADSPFNPKTIRNLDRDVKLR
jgi:hypothetical protein